VRIDTFTRHYNFNSSLDHFDWSNISHLAGTIIIYTVKKVDLLLYDFLGKFECTMNQLVDTISSKLSSVRDLPNNACRFVMHQLTKYLTLRLGKKNNSD